MPEFPKTAEIVIIGGGILGTSTAYYLVKQAQKNVVLLEKNILAQGSTGLCVGGIRQQFSLPANILLSQETVSLFEHFNEEFPVDIGFHQVGYLFLAQKEETWKEFLTSTAVQRQYKVPVELLSPEETKQRWPYLEVKDIAGSTFGPKDGYADPYSVAMAFANKARKLGARIFEKTKVTGIRVKSGQVTDVETTKGNISTPVVINTAGPWGGEVAALAGLKLPVFPYRRQVFVTKPFSLISKPVPMIIDFDASFYFREEGAGILMGMSDSKEPSSFNTNVDWNFLERVIEAAVYRVPLLKSAQIMRGWGGLYEITPDENPIIGAIPEVHGFYCAIGFSGHGFQHGPSVGRILTELILHGDTSFDLSPFASNRFRNRKVQREKRVV